MDVYTSEKVACLDHNFLPSHHIHSIFHISCFTSKICVLHAVRICVLIQSSLTILPIFLTSFIIPFIFSPFFFRMQFLLISGLLPVGLHLSKNCRVIFKTNSVESFYYLFPLKKYCIYHDVETWGTWSKVHLSFIKKRGAPDQKSVMLGGHSIRRDLCIYNQQCI